MKKNIMTFFFCGIFFTLSFVFYNYKGVSTTFVNAQSTCVDPPSMVTDGKEELM